MKLEFGRIYEGDYVSIILADEISPDTCRLWDVESGEKMDKDRFRGDLGNIEEGYREVAKRLGVLPTADVVEAIQPASGPKEAAKKVSQKRKTPTRKPRATKPKK